MPGHVDHQKTLSWVVPSKRVSGVGCVKKWLQTLDSLGSSLKV